MPVMKDDIDNGGLAVVAVVGAILIVAMVFLVQAVYYALDRKEQAAKATRGTEWRGYLSEQQAKLNEYGWVDQEKGVVRIPVDRAMGLLVAEHQAGEGTPAAVPSAVDQDPAGATATDVQIQGAAASNGHREGALPLKKGTRPGTGNTVQAGGAQPAHAP